MKKFHVSLFSLAAPQKTLAAYCELNFDATDLPHSQFEPLYPKVFRVTLKVDLVSSVWPPAPSKLSISKKLSMIFGVFLLLDKIDFPGQTVTFCLQHVIHYMSYIIYITFSECYCSDGSFEDGENGQNVALNFFFLELCCDQPV